MSVVVWLLPSAIFAQSDIAFRRHAIAPDSEFSAATCIDVNQDGKLDIVSGAWWYEAPNWQARKFREVEQIRGRFDDYSNLALDVDGDGDMDIVSVNYRSQSLYWCKNPGSQQQGLWEQILIDTPGASETGRLADIDGDGQMDVLPSGTTFAAWYEIDRTLGQPGEFRWVKHELPPELIGHGVGAGDINGDGRIDVVCPKGWAEAPADPRNGRWLWHPEFQLARDCGLPILCHDVDQDGDTDLIWGRGHNIGLYWTEQVSADEYSVSFSDAIELEDTGRAQVTSQISTSKWIEHAIDTHWSSAHSVMLADIDGDGIEDLVTGKRFMGHDGKDPGENDPLSTWWYRFNRHTKAWTGYKMTDGGTCGIDLDSICADIDGDGDIDLLAPARSGLHWIENLRIATNREGAEPSARVSPQYAQHQQLDHFLGTDGEKKPITSPLDHGVRRQHVLDGLQQAMGSLPNSKRRVPLSVRVEQIVEADKYYRIKLTYLAEAEDRVPAFLLLPKNIDKPTKAMLCLHPTHLELGKAQICGLGGQPSRYYAHELAELGWVCLAPDYPSFAEYPYDFSSDNYVSGSMKAIWNNIRGIDLLESLPCVARDQIGVIGHSLGGHNALFTAAFDQRLRCVVTSCGFNAFEDYYGGDLRGWTSERYMPKIANDFQAKPSQMPFDFPEVLLAIAPRPLFVNAPLQDSNFAVVGVKKCETAVRPIYELLLQGEADKKLEFLYPEAEHDFPEEIRKQAYAWLEANLK